MYFSEGGGTMCIKICRYVCGHHVCVGVCVCYRYVHGKRFACFQEVQWFSS